jgi:hypothetical protein
MGPSGTASNVFVDIINDEVEDVGEPGVSTDEAMVVSTREEA